MNDTINIDLGVNYNIEFSSKLAVASSHITLARSHLAIAIWQSVKLAVAKLLPVKLAASWQFSLFIAKSVNEDRSSIHISNA